MHMWHFPYIRNRMSHKLCSLGSLAGENCGISVCMCVCLCQSWHTHMELMWVCACVRGVNLPHLPLKWLGGERATAVGGEGSADVWAARCRGVMWRRSRHAKPASVTAAYTNTFINSVSLHRSITNCQLLEWGLAIRFFHKLSFMSLQHNKNIYIAQPHQQKPLSPANGHC